MGDVADLMPVFGSRPTPILSADDERLLQVSLEAMADMLVQRQRDLDVIRGLRRDLRRARRKRLPGSQAAGPAVGRVRGVLGRARRRLSRAGA